MAASANTSSPRAASLSLLLLPLLLLLLLGSAAAVRMRQDDDTLPPVQDGDPSQEEHHEEDGDMGVDVDLQNMNHIKWPGSNGLPGETEARVQEAQAKADARRQALEERAFDAANDHPDYGLGSRKRRHLHPRVRETRNVLKDLLNFENDEQQASIHAGNKPNSLDKDVLKALDKFELRREKKTLDPQEEGSSDEAIKRRAEEMQRMQQEPAERANEPENRIGCLATVGGTCHVEPVCLDNAGSSGERFPASCEEAQLLCLKNTRGTRSSGTYRLKVNNKVDDYYCDMESYGGGWTLIANQASSGHWIRGDIDFDPKKNVPPYSPSWDHSQAFYRGYAGLDATFAMFRTGSGEVDCVVRFRDLLERNNDLYARNVCVHASKNTGASRGQYTNNLFRSNPVTPEDPWFGCNGNHMANVQQMLWGEHNFGADGRVLHEQFKNKNGGVGLFVRGSRPC